MRTYIICGTCNCTLLKSSMYNHKRTIKHIENHIENQQEDDVEAYLQQYF